MIILLEDIFIIPPVRLFILYLRIFCILHVRIFCIIHGRIFYPSCEDILYSSWEDIFMLQKVHQLSIIVLSHEKIKLEQILIGGR